MLPIGTECPLPTSIPGTGWPSLPMTPTNSPNHARTNHPEPSVASSIGAARCRSSGSAGMGTAATASAEPAAPRHCCRAVQLVPTATLVSVVELTHFIDRSDDLADNRSCTLL